MTEERESIEIFCCYAHEDKDLLLDLKSHLASLKRLRSAKLWHDADISPGMDWENEVHQHLNTAEIILLLVSPDFMASDYCYSIELQRAMERQQQGEVVVIPIILRPVYWKDAPFGRLEALPTKAVPVTGPAWSNRDEAFFDVAEGIRKVIEALSSSESTERLKLDEIKQPQGTILHQFDLPKYSGELNLRSLIWSPDSKYFAFASITGGVEVRDAVTGWLIFHKSPIIKSIAWSPDSQYIAMLDLPIEIAHVLYKDQKRYVGLKNREQIKLHSSFLRSIAWSPNGKYLLAEDSQSGYVLDAFSSDVVSHYRAWDLESMKPVWSPDSQYIARGEIWEALTGKRVEAYEGEVIAWSPDGKWMALGCGGRPTLFQNYNPRIEIFEAMTHNSISSYRGHSDSVSALAWSPDGKWMASGGKDKTVRIWNAKTQETLFTYRNHNSEVTNVSWSPNKKWIASGDKNQKVYIWQAF